MPTLAIRDRVKELRRVPARDLLPSPRNWRRHPESQANALRGLLSELGFSGALLVREVEGGQLELIDGHLRAETVPDMLVPVLVLDVDEAEAAKLLATFDPLGTLAEADTAALESLLAEVQTDSPAVRALLDGLAAAVGAWSGEAAVAVPTDTVVGASPADMAVPIVTTGHDGSLPQLAERVNFEPRRGAHV